MSKKTWYTALTGLLFFLLVVVLIALGQGNFDATKDPVSEIAKDFDDSTKFYVSIVLQMIAIVMLVWYGGHLRNALRESSVAPLITAGTAILAVGLAVDGMLCFALFEAFDDPDVAIAPGAIQAIALVFNNDFMPFVVGGSVLAFASGLGILHTGALPKWLGWVALVIGVVAVAGPAGFIGLMALLIWIAVTSVMLAIKTKNA